MSISVVFIQMIMIVILMGVGYLCIKTGLITTDAKKPMSSLVVNVFNPALLLYSMVTNNSVESSDVVVTLAAGGVMYAGLILCGTIFGRLASKDQVTQRVRHLMYVFANTGFIGIPVVKAVLGDEYLIYVAIINLEFTALFYTYGYMQALKEGEKFSARSLKSMFNVGTISCILGLILFLMKAQLPSLIVQSISYLGNATTPMAMLIVGITMAEQKSLLDIFKNVKLYPFCVIRMIVIPLIAAFALKAAPIPEAIRQVTLFMTAMPVGNMALMLLVEKGIDSKDCSDSIIITTLLSVITIPLIIMIYLHL